MAGILAVLSLDPSNRLSFWSGTEVHSLCTFAEPWLILHSIVYLPLSLHCLNPAFPSDVCSLSHLRLGSQGFLMLKFVSFISTQLQWCIIALVAVLYMCLFSDRIFHVCCCQHFYCSCNFLLSECQCPHWVQSAHIYHPQMVSSILSFAG